MLEITRRAPAKINLTLRVMPRRPDGFHDIESLVARVNYCDEIAVAARDDRRITLACDDPTVPCDDSNLACRAARLLSEQAGVRGGGVHIDLKKRIPAGAGLGGGSSDAAATLMILNDLWNLNLTTTELSRIGADLGSDVPLFFHSPLCIIRGRGEIVEDLDRVLAGWAVLILPKIHSSTPAVYQAFDEAPPPPARLDPEDILSQAPDADALMPLLFNNLEVPAIRINDRLARTARRLHELNADPIRITGSGSAFFKLFDDRAAATAFAMQIKEAKQLDDVATRVAATCTE